MGGGREFFEKNFSARDEAEKKTGPNPAIKKKSSSIV